MKINVKEIIKSDIASAVEDAIKIKELILKELNDGEFPTIDFTGIETITPAFVNLAIGDLYEECFWDDFDRIDYIATKEQLEMINLLIETAKQYWCRKDMEKDINDKEITTHEQLLKMHGKKITCDIDGEHIDDARISVEAGYVFVCQNIMDGSYGQEKFEYKYSWVISRRNRVYEEDNQGCINIKLAEEEQENLDLDKAIDNITPKQVITPPNHYKLEINNQVVDVNMILEAVAKKLDKCDLMTWAYFTNSIEYLLRSWFKGQQISDLEKAKSEIDFMINRIKGNK